MKDRGASRGFSATAEFLGVSNSVDRGVGGERGR